MKIDKESIMHFHDAKACPDCGHKLDAGIADDNVNGRAPRKDDFCVCAYCGSVMRFANDEADIRKITREDLNDLSLEQQMDMLQMKLKIKAMRFKRDARDGDEANG